MAKNQKVDSRDVGLELALVFGKFFGNTEDLHYGYWKDGLEPLMSNFGKAQANHSDLILANIPEGTQTILDVGAGSGNLAAKLIAEGYSVDCVSPSEYLSEKIMEKLDGKGTLFQCKFEDIETDKTYDLVIFSESFQYIKPDDGFSLSASVLKENGHILICDFFRTEEEGHYPLMGGHRFSKFSDARENAEFIVLTDIDITMETSLTVTVFDQFLTEVAPPVRDLAANYFSINYPKISKIIAWKFRKKLEKLDRKYLSGNTYTDDYLKYQTYRLLLLKQG